MPTRSVRHALSALGVLGMSLALVQPTAAGPFFWSSSSNCAQAVEQEPACDGSKCKKKFGPKDPPVAPVVGVIPTALVAQTVVPVAPGALPAATNRDDQIDRLLRLLQAVEATNSPTAAVPATDPQLQRDLQLMRLLLQELRKQP